jgi:hypothetical protein
MSRKLKLKMVFNEKSLEDCKDSSCLLTISVGQDYHEGERFISTVSLINENFKSCKILVVDTLQRYTMSLNSEMMPDYFYNSSLKEGDAWLSRNEKYYSILNCLDGVVRWDFWLQHPKYQYFYDLLRVELEQDETYKALFDKTINSYLDRYKLRIHNPAEFNRDRAYKICFSYILEECAAYCIWPEVDCDFEVYPVRRNAAMIETYKRFILKDARKLYPLDIQFGKDGLAKPQQFYFAE